MNIRVSELRAVAEILFSYLEKTGREEFTLTDDYYWTIAKEQLYDPMNDPDDLSIGQLSEDWARLDSILEEKSPPIGYAMVWLSAVLRNIGEKAVY